MRLKYFLHPISVFVFLQIIWLTITLLWVIWFVGALEGIKTISLNFGTHNLDPTYALIIMIVGCVLLGMLLVGTVALFVLGQRQSNLINQQRSFVSSVTHELRSPLASLKLSLETMQLRKLDNATHATLHSMALTDIERLSKLVNQILISARLDQGLAGFSENPETITLREVLDRQLTKVEWLDPQIKSRVELDCPQDLRVHISEGLFSLLVCNILENAIKFSPSGSVIKIAGKQKESHFIISICDLGLGLVDKDLKMIFKMFYRSKTATQKAIAGTGLGLFIVRSLTRFLGGQVWVESAGLNLGSTFYLKLPLRK